MGVSCIFFLQAACFGVPSYGVRVQSQARRPGLPSKQLIREFISVVAAAPERGDVRVAPPEGEVSVPVESPIQPHTRNNTRRLLWSRQTD